MVSMVLVPHLAHLPHRNVRNFRAAHGLFMALLFCNSLPFPSAQILWRGAGWSLYDTGVPHVGRVAYDFMNPS